MSTTRMKAQSLLGVHMRSSAGLQATFKWGIPVMRWDEMRGKHPLTLHEPGATNTSKRKEQLWLEGDQSAVTLRKPNEENRAHWLWKQAGIHRGAHFTHVFLLYYHYLPNNSILPSGKGNYALYLRSLSLAAAGGRWFRGSRFGRDAPTAPGGKRTPAGKGQSVSRSLGIQMRELGKSMQA